jgi:ABC-type antimicrobial peptide transport system permease subunit
MDMFPFIRFSLLFLAALVLAVACMNIANILLVRATVREREMAIRAALGSGRGRLIRQMLTESLLLAMLGAIVGMILGKWASQTFAMPCREWFRSARLLTPASTGAFSRRVIGGPVLRRTHRDLAGASRLASRTGRGTA